MKTLQLSEEKAKELYKTASPEFRAMLEETFEKEFFVSIETVEEAMKYLELKEDAHLWVKTKYVERVKAFYNLSVLCDAWNKQDGFVPDFEDPTQERWYPLFSYAGCSYLYSFIEPSGMDATFGSRICFKSRERADEFGKKYEYLFKTFLRG